MLKDVSRGAGELTDVSREPVALIFSAVGSMGISWNWTWGRSGRIDEMWNSFLREWKKNELDVEYDCWKAWRILLGFLE